MESSKSLAGRSVFGVVIELGELDNYLYQADSPDLDADDGSDETELPVFDIDAELSQLAVVVASVPVATTGLSSSTSAATTTTPTVTQEEPQDQPQTEPLVVLLSHGNGKVKTEFAKVGLINNCVKNRPGRLRLAGGEALSRITVYFWYRPLKEQTVLYDRKSIQFFIPANNGLTPVESVRNPPAQDDSVEIEQRNKYGSEISKLHRFVCSTTTKFSASMALSETQFTVWDLDGGLAEKKNKARLDVFVLCVESACGKKETFCLRPLSNAYLHSRKAPNPNKRVKRENPGDEDDDLVEVTHVL